MLESIWSFLLDFVSKPDQVLLAIIEKYHNWVYVFLFLIIFAETGLIIASFLMPFLPGDALIFTIGLLAQEGSLNIYLVIPLLIFAAMVLSELLPTILTLKV
jgi:membrane-associated protein